MLLLKIVGLLSIVMFKLCKKTPYYINRMHLLNVKTILFYEDKNECVAKK